MKYARDIMTKNLSVCSTTDDLNELALLFISTNYKSVPIVDEEENCVGIMSELGLLRAFSQHTQSKNKLLVSDHLNCLSPPIFIDPNETFDEFIPKVIGDESHRIIVASGSKKPLGIISPKDILHTLLGVGKASKNMTKDIQDVERKISDGKDSDEPSFYKEAFDESPFYMILSDKEDQVISINKKLAELRNNDADSFVGKPISDLFPRFAHKQLLNSLHSAKMNGKSPPIPTALSRENESLVSVEIAASTVRDSEKKLKYVVTVLRDVGI
ncbi:MAG: CBS domain-containing protein [Bdellovibrionales bacterium]